MSDLVVRDHSKPCGHKGATKAPEYVSVEPWWTCSAPWCPGGRDMVLCRETIGPDSFIYASEIWVSRRPSETITVFELCKHRQADPHTWEYMRLSDSCPGGKERTFEFFGRDGADEDGRILWVEVTDE